MSDKGGAWQLGLQSAVKHSSVCLLHKIRSKRGHAPHEIAMAQLNPGQLYLGAHADRTQSKSI
jgi:hypothetical protein